MDLFKGLLRFSGLAVALPAFLGGLMACTDDVAYTPHVAPDSVPSENTPSDSAADSVSQSNGPLMFTEIDPTNLVYEDHEGDDGGWVEIFNTSNEPVDLAGKYLTNKLDKPTKWKFGNVVVPPQGYVLVFLSGKDLPDYVAPSDTMEMVGTGCWKWTDSQAEPVAGFSYANLLPGYKKICFTSDSKRQFGSVMKFGDNAELGWSSISVFVGTGSSDKEDVQDISSANEILMQAYITKDRKVSFRLAQPDVDDWQGYEFVFTGTGDSSTVYRATLPAGVSFPDLKNIYGTRMSPESKESQEVTVKVFSYLARNRGHEPHASFKAKKEGGSLYLMDEAGQVMASLNYPEIPAGKSWSYGVVSAGESSEAGWGFGEPSPYGFAEQAVVSVRSPALDSLTQLPPSGFYKEPFVVSFPEGMNIRCHVGGKVPDENSPEITLLGIEKTQVLRCRSMVPGTLPGKVMTRTYIFEDASTVPAIFVTADPGSLFSQDSGIYAEGYYAQDADPHYGANYWWDKEIPVHVELLEVGSRQPDFSKDAGLSIFGNYSRMNAKKSVAVTFREKYGENRLEYPLFPEFPVLKSFKAFILRCNGSNFGNDYIRDMLASSISEGLGVDYQRGRAAVVFYNGEYYGIHNIRERSTEYYFETHYGMDPKKIDLLKADNSASNGSGAEYQAMMSWLEDNHLDKAENYAKVAAQMDVDNFMNYVQTELFVNNRDWPSNNLKKWRSSDPKTLWKWFIYDTDFGFGTNMSQFKNNIFEFATAEDGDSWPNGPASTLLLRRLLENDSFKNAFINRMSVLLSMNFESSRVKSRIDKLMGDIQGEIPRDQRLWGHKVNWFDSQLKTIYSFAQNRPGVILAELREFFDLGTLVPMVLAADGGGTLSVCGLELDRESMDINFFDGLPVELTAVPKPGHVFVQWSDGVTDASRIILPEKGVSLKAQFR